MGYASKKKEIEVDASLYEEFLKVRKSPGRNLPTAWETENPELYELATSVCEYNRSRAFDPALKRLTRVPTLKFKAELSKIKHWRVLKRLERRYRMSRTLRKIR